ncbi:hypothetical protein SynA1528_00169 [Synechococcus sp. A15-28]|nr:hypothetical protein SynA1528_00169 [Synechococcus sp. A15-28]
MIRSCFSKEEIYFIKESMLNLQEKTESTFYKMDRLIPDYWRNITPEIAKKYSVPIVKQAAYFFPWNDQKELFALINRRWRLYKVLGGRSEDFAEHSKPEEGYVDRIQVVQYHANSGYLPAHQDPDHNQRLFISGYLSKQGHDFMGGGFWALNSKKEQQELEGLFLPGDMGVGSARIIHGVNKIQGKGGDIRWFLGLYTNDSDCVKKRKTLQAA